MDTILTIQPGRLAAVAMYAAKKDVRFYLQGVCIDTGPMGTFIVATDGAAMAVHRIDDISRPCAQLLLPLAALEGAIKANKKSPVLLTLPDGCQGTAKPDALRSVTVAAAGVASTITEADCHYPEWRRVTRHQDAAEMACFDPAIVDRVARSSALIHRGTFPAMLRPGGHGCGFAWLDAVGECVAYVMPMRQKPSDLPHTPSMTY